VKRTRDLLILVYFLIVTEPQLLLIKMIQIILFFKGGSSTFEAAEAVDLQYDENFWNRFYKTLQKLWFRVARFILDTTYKNGKKIY
jgi:hypothetical protein